MDVVIHSLTKYIGGHGDLLGGAVISNDTEFLRLKAPNSRTGHG